MNKYIIDGNIDFYKELLNDDESKTDDNVCLLTGLPLIKNHIKLPCAHTFNYEALYNEVRNQKQFNEYNIHILQVYDIKCPYCRNVSHNLLPYVPIIKKEKINGVNSPDKYTMNHKSCSYQLMRGKNKGDICNENGFETDNEGDLCEKHWKKSILVKNKDKEKEKDKTKKMTSKRVAKAPLTSANVVDTNVVDTDTNANVVDTNVVETNTI
jgi:hypothetical protein